MLSQEIKIKFFLIVSLGFFLSCSHDREGNRMLEKSKTIATAHLYNKVYGLMNDSIKNWCSNKLGIVTGESLWGFNLDSLMCFNATRTKAVCSILVPCKDPKCVQDEIKFFYGEQINNSWYFFRGPSIAVPREMVKSHNPREPLSYSQLHEIAIKEVYGSYLKENGEIRDGYFDNYARATGCDNCDTKEKEEKWIIGYCKGLWAEKYLPYSNQDFNFVYNSQTRDVDFSFRLKTFDSIYNRPKLYKVIYEYPGLGYLDGACGSYFCPEFDWEKEKVAHVTIKNIPPDKEIKIYLEIVYEPNVRSPRMGPFIFYSGKQKITS